MYWPGLSVYYLWHITLVLEQAEPGKGTIRFYSSAFVLEVLTFAPRALLLLLSDATDRDIMIE